MVFLLFRPVVQLLKHGLQLCGDGQTKVCGVLKQADALIGDIKENSGGSKNGATADHVYIQHMPNAYQKNPDNPRAPDLLMTLGVALAGVCFVKIMLVDRLLLGNGDVTVLVAAVVCLTMAMTILVAKIVGCTLPMFAKKLGFDPAVMASPFITTIVDALSLLVYFLIATTLLHL